MTAATMPGSEVVFARLGEFIAGLLPIERTQIVRGLGNRVPMPLPGFVAMTEISQNRLATNISSYNDYGTATTGERAVTMPTQYAIQIDCYGPNAADWAVMLVTMLRDAYGCEAMAPEVQPLHADDARAAPLVNGEAEYEQRWIVTAQLQYNPVTTVQQQSAVALAGNSVEIDATFNPLRMI